MSPLDVKATVEEINIRAKGLRLLNVYDVTPKTFLFKFGHGDTKVLLLVESGVRMHVTTLDRSKPKVPSQFTLKLRKHIRSWRLDSVEQLQFDRTVDMKFGVDTASFHIIVELHGKGNVVLTDHEYRTLMILRRDPDVPCHVKDIYPLPQSLPDSPAVYTCHRLLHEKNDESGAASLLKCLLLGLDSAQPNDSLKTVVCNVTKLGPVLAEHALLGAGVKPNVRKSDLTAVQIASMQSWLVPPLLGTLRMMLVPGQPGGFLIKRNTDGQAATGAAAATPLSEQAQEVTQEAGQQQLSPSPSSLAPQAIVYDDFQPVLLRQYQGHLDLTISGRRSFGEILDQFFFPSEAKKIVEHNEKKETTVVGKKEKFLKDHQRRLNQLETLEEQNRRKGEMIMQHADKIDEAIALITGSLAQGISWAMLHNLLKRAHASGHAVAYMINDLHFERNAITVLLEEEVDDDTDESDVLPVEVEIDLGMTARANASRYFQLKKQSHKKLEKTVEATEKATASAERKGQRVAQKQGPAKKEILIQRPTNWWEKFLWFVTSVGHICVCATDDQQAELLVRRYLRAGDIFVFTDAPKAHPCVVKGSVSSLEPMALISLQEAGAFCVARSDAWHSKQSMSPWWVYASQVTKGNPDGRGMFSVQGQRNYLKAMELSLAASLVFLTSRAREAVFVDEAIPKEPEQRHSSSDSTEAAGPLPFTASPANAPAATTPPPVRKSSSKDKLLGRSRSTTSSQCDSTEESTSEQISRSSQSSAADAAAAAKSKRQLHKIKKIQKKYVEQDDEDRERAMSLLGNDISKVHKSLLRSEDAAKKAATRAAANNAAHDDDEEAVNSDDADGADGARQRKKEVRFAEEEHPLSVEKGGQMLFDATADAVREEQRRRSLSFEDDEEKLNERLEREASTVLPFLTNQPEPSDEIKYALLVCTPFSASVTAKYRVLLTPGNEKKGLAAKSLLAHFQGLSNLLIERSEAQESEKLAIVRMDDNQALQQLIGGVKLHFPPVPSRSTGSSSCQHPSTSRQSQSRGLHPAGGSLPSNAPEGAAASAQQRHADPQLVPAASVRCH